MVNKNLAISLRKRGYTYPEIAAAIGCSEIWCKKNLKGIVKEVTLTDELCNAKEITIQVLEDALARLRAI